jgi:transcriptional regulator with XRE-family HTH domain
MSSTIRKIKEAYDVTTNSQLAEKLDTTRGAVEGWARRKEVPHKYLIKCTFDTGVSLDWLLSEDKPTFHISGGSKNISQVNGGTINQGSEKEEELELFEEFKKIENLAKMTNKMDFLEKELKTIKEKLIEYL